MAKELNRIAAIRKVCNSRHPSIEAKAIAEGWDLTRTELEILRADRPSAPAVQTIDNTIRESVAMVSGSAPGCLAYRSKPHRRICCRDSLRQVIDVVVDLITLPTIHSAQLTNPMFETIGYLLICWLTADLMSGFWHWLEDRYFDTEWPIIGKYIAKPNQLHHDQPIVFTRSNYWHRNYTAILPAAVVGLLALAYQCWHLAVICVMVSQANEIHAWAHQRCNWFIRMFQETGIIQSPVHHGQHHHDPFEIKYCVMTDWLNPILDSLGFWRTAEFLLNRIGIPVRNVSYAEAYSQEDAS